MIAVQQLSTQTKATPKQQPLIDSLPMDHPDSVVAFLLPDFWNIDDDDDKNDKTKYVPRVVRAYEALSHVDELIETRTPKAGTELAKSRPRRWWHFF